MQLRDKKISFASKFIQNFKIFFRTHYIWVIYTANGSLEYCSLQDVLSAIVSLVQFPAPIFQINGTKHAAEATSHKHTCLHIIQYTHCPCVLASWQPYPSLVELVINTGVCFNTDVPLKAKVYKYKVCLSSDVLGLRSCFSNHSYCFIISLLMH